MSKRESLSKSTAKHIARTQGKRIISDKLGTGMIGAIASTLFSQVIKHADKYEINHNKDFGTLSIDKRSSE